LEVMRRQAVRGAPPPLRRVAVYGTALSGGRPRAASVQLGDNGVPDKPQTITNCPHACSFRPGRCRRHQACCPPQAPCCCKEDRQAGAREQRTNGSGLAAAGLAGAAGTRRVVWELGTDSTRARGRRARPNAVAAVDCSALDVVGHTQVWGGGGGRGACWVEPWEDVWRLVCGGEGRMQVWWTHPCFGRDKEV
jgi:hypothetical protein